MNILSAENITKSYGERMLFNKASFYLQEGEKVGVIGINGTGKTTLLRMLSGLEEPDEGTVTCANHVIISFLPQHPVFEENDTVLNAIIRRYQSSGSGHKNEQEIMTQAKAMLTRLGVGNFEARCGTLSGGERKRIALVAALISPADILLLDEPTNHLDNEMADWLEEQLKKFTGAVIMVTHDRYFLDSVSGRIVEIDKGNIYSYQTGYSGYLELKAKREEAALASFRKRQSVLRKELEWVKRGARARTTKQKARLERFEELSSTSAPVSDGRVEIGSVSARMGKTTVELSHISKSYGDTILIRDFSYIFLKNDRVGFIGHNGCGKTTLMKILTGKCEPDTGSITIGQTVKIGYYAQEINEIEMPPEKRVIDYIRDVAEYVQTEDGSITASQMLEKFLFEGKEQYGLLGKLSGGEKRRLNLLKVLMGAPN
ncbi:MAG: ABC-F family ATP-binding cassette domain-containing protein, partial [Bacillota bacterium]|nr:ABC-F family ATP-binding cassette domain-containing protein [Bacillota bacterium]